MIAFIPNEALLQAAMEADPTLMDDAFARKVALTSPVTLWAVLKSVAYAWQQQSLTDDAKTLFDLSRELYERFAVLGERANKLGTALTRTGVQPIRVIVGIPRAGHRAQTAEARSGHGHRVGEHHRSGQIRCP